MSKASSRTISIGNSIRSSKGNTKANSMKSAATNLSLAVDPAMFDLSEYKSHYMIALDIPSIPTLSPEIFTIKNELKVEGISEEHNGKQSIFRCSSLNSGLTATYKDGILWISLPKCMTEPTALSAIG